VEVGGAGGGGFVGFELSAFVEVGGVGVDDFEHAAAEEFEGGGVVFAGGVHEVLGREVALPGGEAGGECGQGADDHPRLRQVEVSGLECVADERVVLVQGLGEAEVGVGAGAGGPGVVGETGCGGGGGGVRGGGGGGVRGDVGGVGGGQRS